MQDELKEWMKRNVHNATSAIELAHLAMKYSYTLSTSNIRIDYYIWDDAQTIWDTQQFVNTTKQYA